MNITKIDQSKCKNSDYELMSNGSSNSLSLNDSYSYESDFASGSSVRSSIGEFQDEIHHMAKNQVAVIPRNIFPSTTNLPVISLVNEAWEYRGEGGANLVISITGRQKIVRFKKT